MQKTFTKTQKLTFSAMYIAMYIVIMALTQSFAFGQYQIRIATTLYALAYFNPFLIIPAGLANLMSNLFFGGLGIIDMLGGTLVGIITASLVYAVRKYNPPKWCLILPIIFIPGIVVPIYLSQLLAIPFLPLVVSLCIGQSVPAFVGYFLVQALEKRFYKSALLKS